jgi:hypothetical protein
MHRPYSASSPAGAAAAAVVYVGPLSAEVMPRIVGSSSFFSSSLKFESLTILSGVTLGWAAGTTSAVRAPAKRDDQQRSTAAAGGGGGGIGERYLADMKASTRS